MDPLAIAGGAGILVIVGIALVALVVIGLIALIFIRAWYRVAKADEALVIVGKSQKSADGTASRITVITGGGAIVNPLTQRAEMISLRSRQIKMEPTAQSENGVTVNVSGVALFKIGSDPEMVRRAAERFASQDKAIEQFTTEQLEGALRGVVATLTVEQLMKDRQRLSDQIAEGIKNDLLAQGLILDSFQIQGVTDANGYIAALGATEVERVRRDAEVARIDAERQVKAREIATSQATLVEQTALDTNRAGAQAEVGRANAEAEQAEKLARAEREQSVLLQQAENKQAQLDADVKKVADANLYQQERAADADAYAKIKAAEAQAKIAEQDAIGVRARANADAEAIRMRGQAQADAIRAEAEALAENQQAVLAKEALSQLVPMMAEFAKAYQQVGSITVLGGEGAGNHFATESAASLRSAFDAVRATTGLDLASIIQGQAIGRGIAEATGESRATRRSRAAADSTVDTVTAAGSAAAEAGLAAARRVAEQHAAQVRGEQSSGHTASAQHNAQNSWPQQ